MPSNGRDSNLVDKFFWTKYRPKMNVFQKGDTPGYGTGVWAADLGEAYDLVDKRNVDGEYVEDIFQPAKDCIYEPVHVHVELALENKKNRKYFNNALHGVTFLCYLAGCSGSTNEELLGDGGVLHEFIHVITTSGKYSWCEFEHMMIAVIDLELKVPGYLSREQKEHVIRYKNSLQERITRQA